MCEHQTSIAEKNSKVFDQMALGWDTNPSKAEFSKRIAQAIKEVFDKVSHTLNKQSDLLVMDFGAGTGTLSFLFLREFNDKIAHIESKEGQSHERQCVEGTG